MPWFSRRWVGALAIASALVALSACRDSTGGTPLEVSRAERRQAIVSKAITKANARGATRSAREYLAGNPMGYIADLHNSGVREVVAAIARDKTGRPCQAIARALRSQSWLGTASSHLRKSERESAGQLVLNGVPGCSHVSAASFEPYVARQPVGDALYDYLSAIQASMSVTDNSAALATAVSAIVDDASAVLSSGDMDLVNAMASFTVGTAVYWEENGSAEYEALAGSPVGACLGVDPLNQYCIYASSGSRESQPLNGYLLNASVTRGPSRSLSLANARFEARRNPSCPYKWNGWDVAAGDVGGFFGGLLSTFNPVVAGLAAAGTSVGVFIVEGGHEIYCSIR